MLAWCIAKYYNTTHEVEYEPSGWEHKILCERVCKYLNANCPNHDYYHYPVQVVRDKARVDKHIPTS